MAEFCASRDFDTLREQLVERYAEPLAQITEEVRSTEEGIRLYRAMTRFLYEDSQLPDTPLSNTALQRDAKARTHAVIQRSRAWGNLLAERFPEAIRLSIHPQASHSLKMGIHMLPTRMTGSPLARGGGQPGWPVRADEAARRTGDGA